jgi:hypothetical protein
LTTNNSKDNSQVDVSDPTEGNFQKFSVENYLHNLELPLPLFDEKLVNPVLHLKQLDNYIKLKKIPNEGKLILAYRSMNGEMSKQWIETIINQIRDYKNFKQEFFNTWWSTSQQSLVKCSLYRNKYSKQSNLSLSAHFLKYATMASYLDPKLSELNLLKLYDFIIH